MSLEKHEVPAIPRSKPRFLVIGASGLVGQRFLRALGPECAHGTYHRHGFPGAARFDLATDCVADLLDRLDEDFTHGVILGGVVNIDECARDPVRSKTVNVEGIIKAVDGLVARGMVPIFASSDAVYDGSRGSWREDDAANPIIVYGRYKREIEQYLARKNHPFLALRIAKVLDAELSHSGVIGPWITELLTHKPIRCATDQRFCPLGADDVVAAIRLLAEAGASGIFNLGGAEPVSRIELLEKTIAAVSHHRTIDPLIERCSIRDFPFLEPRPIDLTISIEKLKATVAFDPEPLAALCSRAAAKAIASATES